MKKFLITIIFCTSVISAFLMGMFFSKSNSKTSAVGVYNTDSWNDKSGTLVLYNDGTCQYPSGESATWLLREDTVVITIGYSKRITLYFESSLSDTEIKEKISVIEKLDGVESVSVIDDTRLCYVTLNKADTDKMLVETISNTGGIKLIGNGSVTNVSEHEAKIMENGLVLHGHFFEKVSS